MVAGNGRKRLRGAADENRKSPEPFLTEVQSPVFEKASGVISKAAGYPSPRLYPPPLSTPFQNLFIK